ncbi:hypothetical protein Pelo_18668 [Pelomyxa schiedti]|nr:hypothetical protein Pelo_18668 [Pelomyxa schiedti]
MGVWEQTGSCVITRGVTDANGNVDVCDSHGEEEARVVWDSGLHIGMSPHAYCNRRWIVALRESSRVSGQTDLRVWKVARGDGIPVEPPVDLCGLELKAAGLEFPHLCADLVMVFPLEETSIPVVDLAASFNTGSLVVPYSISCVHKFPRNVVWMPDGSHWTLHFDSPFESPVSFLENPENHQRHVFQEERQVAAISKKHIFAVSTLPSGLLQFKVYRTGRSLRAFRSPTLCVPCTWASPGNMSQTGLILSTRHDLKSYSPPCVVFSLHDGISTIHLGCFSVPHQFFFCNSSACLLL